MNRIIRYFPETHMSLSHIGLRQLAKTNGVTNLHLERGEFLVFMNKAQNAFKLMTANNIICYFKHPERRRIDLRTVSLIPTFFNGKEFNYTGALRAAITKALEPKMKEAA